MSMFEVYVDGSYNEGSGEAYGAFVLLQNGEPIFLWRIITKDPRFTSQWNVGGELLAAAAGIANGINVLKQARETGVCKDSTIELYHDYIGIKAFIVPVAPGKKVWKPKDPDGATAYYKRMVDVVLEENYPLKVVFTKVKAHSGVKWNEVVDGIAAGRVTSYNGLDVFIQKM